MYTGCSPYSSIANTLIILQAHKKSDKMHYLSLERGSSTTPSTIKRAGNDRSLVSAPDHEIEIMKIENLLWNVFVKLNLLCLRWVLNRKLWKKKCFLFFSHHGLIFLIEEWPPMLYGRIQNSEELYFQNNFCSNVYFLLCQYK